MRKRQAQAEETKRLILQEAFKLMERQGFHSTTISQISRAAGISVGAFYYHFETKEALLSGTYAEADQYFSSEVATLLTNTAISEQAAVYFQKYAEYNQALGLDRIKVLYNTDNQWFLKKGRDMQKVLEEALRRQRDSGWLRSGLDPAQATEELFVVARGVVFDWCLQAGVYSLADRMVPIIRQHMGAWLN
jgi:AcrR family transcriptional regulator